MPTNEFEKQVQKQLDDFQLNPSATVWEKVEAQIREKKRRRVVFFYIPIAAAFLLLGFGIYQFIINNDRTETVVQNPSATKQNVTGDQANASTSTSQSNTSIPEKTNTTNTVTTQDVGLKNDPVSTTIQTNTSTSILLQEPKKNNSAKNTGLRYNQKKQQDPVMEIDVDKGQVAKRPGSKDQKDKAGKDNSTLPVDKKDVVIQDAISSNDQNAETANKKDEIATADPNKTAESATNDNKENKNDAEKPKPVQNWPEMRWGVDFFAGIASTQTGIFSLEKSMAADMMAPGVGTGGPQSPARPSSINNGPSFRIGAVGELQVSKKSRFSAGLQYSYVSTKINTGRATDTSLVLQSNNSFASTVQVDRIYSGAPNFTYTNKFHFISLPVSYHLQLNKGKKLPIQWDLGMSVNYLIATNALVYSNYIGGIYYEDKEVFNKLHFNLGTGVSFRLKSKNGSEWVLGPSLSFGLNRLTPDENQYLMYGGINARYLLPKKKNK